MHHRQCRSAESTVIRPLLLGLLVLASAAAHANAVPFFDTFGLGPSPSTWVPPVGDELSITQRPFHQFSIFTEDSGDYVFNIENDDSQFSDEALPGALLLYQGTFDPTAPQTNLITFVRFGRGETTIGEFTATLVNGVRYILVTTVVDDFEGIHSYRGQVSSNLVSREIHGSPCSPVGDEISVGDSPGDGWVFQENKFCATTRWRTSEGAGFGQPVGYRTDDSMLFWFFEPNNWELQVKVLNGCNINGHYWVFLSASTDVEVEVEVFGRGPNIGLSRKIYRSELGAPFETVTDTEAFPCDQVADDF